MTADDRIRESREFFGPRATGWDERFPDDGSAFARAVADVGPMRDGVVLDVGCGTGRALPSLRTAVGEGGRLVAVDVTPEMLAVARQKGRDREGALALGDARRLPLATGAFDVVFAAGLITHVADPAGTLAELARVSRAGARLALFHPVGRAALAARHGRTLRPDELLDPSVLPRVLAASGWERPEIDDAAERYLAIAIRSAS